MVSVHSTSSLVGFTMMSVMHVCSKQGTGETTFSGKPKVARGVASPHQEDAVLCRVCRQDRSCRPDRSQCPQLTGMPRMSDASASLMNHLRMRGRQGTTFKRFHMGLMGSGPKLARPGCCAIKRRNVGSPQAPRDASDEQAPGAHSLAAGRSAGSSLFTVDTV